MGIHKAPGELNKLPDVSADDDLRKARRHSHIQGAADEIGTFHDRLVPDAEDGARQIRPDIAGRKEKDLLPERALLPDLEFDARKERLLAHRLHDPARTEDRKASLDPETRIEGLFRDLFPAGNGNGNGKTARPPALLHYFQYGAPDHFPRHRIDRRLSDRELESRLRYAADPFAAVDPDLLPGRQGRPGINEHAVRHVRIVPAVLPDGAGRPALPGGGIQYRKGKLNTFRREDPCPFRRLPGKEELRGSLRGTRGAGPGGIAESQLFSVLQGVIGFNPRSVHP